MLTNQLVYDIIDNMSNELSIRVRVKPDAQDECVLNQLIDSYLSACNHVSDVACSKQVINNRDLHDLTYTVIRVKYNLMSQLACSVIRQVSGNYKTIIANNKNYDYDKRSVYTSRTIELTHNRDWYYNPRTQNAKISTPNGAVILHDVIMPNYLREYDYKFGGAKLQHKRNGWFLIITIKLTDEPYVRSMPSNVIGVDAGLRFIITTFDGYRTDFISGREVMDKRRQYSEKRAELQSKGTSAARHRLLMLGDRENRWMTDVNHQISKALINRAKQENACIILENLIGIQSTLVKSRKNDRYYRVSWAYAQLRDMILYKARLAGVIVYLVNPRFTSQVCPACGYRDKSARNHKLHLFKCSHCGYSSNDDRIGAMNIRARGIEDRLIPEFDN